MEKSFGEFLTIKRKEKGFTQKELAEKLYVSESAVSKWEKDKARPDIALLPQLGEILSVSEHELITASVDVKQREQAKNAHKWKILSSSWQLFFLISYGIALLSCFITNLAVDHTLSWFWIVFTSIMFAASFTTIPKYITKFKTLIISLLELGLLVLLLGVCCIYTKGDWFLTATIPTMLGFIAVFLPIYIHLYNVPKIIKELNGLISYAVDIIILIIMYYILDNYSVKNGYISSHWATSFAVPITLIFAIIPLMMIFVIKFIKYNKLIKTAICLFISSAIYPMIQIVIDQFMHVAFDYAKPTTYAPNLAKWSNPYINNNIMLFCVFGLILMGITFLIFGIIKQRKLQNS